MHYYLTDGGGIDWKGRAWGEGVRHEDDNPNYRFTYYDDPQVALLMAPACERPGTPQVWLCEPSGSVGRHDFRGWSTALTTLRPVEPSRPSEEQRIAFGIVCALNAVPNPTFSAWALGWLRGVDRTPAAALATSEALSEVMGPEEEEVLAPAHAALASAVTDPDFHAAAAGCRAYHDGGDVKLSEIAAVVMMMSPEDIGAMLAEADEMSKGENENNKRDGGRAVGGCGGPEAALPGGGEAGADHPDLQGPADVGQCGLRPGSQAVPSGEPTEERVAVGG